MSTVGLFCLTLLLHTGPVTAADPVNGASVYREYCAMCHGAKGEGIMPGAPDFRTSRTLFQPDQTLLERIEMGAGACPSYFGVLSRSDLRDLIAHLRLMR